MAVEGWLTLFIPLLALGAWDEWLHATLLRHGSLTREQDKLAACTQSAVLAGDVGDLSCCHEADRICSAPRLHVQAEVTLLP